MTRTILIGLAGAVIVAVALVLNDTLNETPVTEDPAAGEESAAAAGDGAGEGAEAGDAATDGDTATETASAPDAESVAAAGETSAAADGAEGSTPSETDAQAAESGDAATGQAEAPEADAEATTEAAGDAAAEEAEPDRPSFDVVRISKSGDTVIAGRAPPGSKVTILDGREPIGTATADSRGEWVYLPSEPLTPGSHELSLRAEIEEGEQIESPGRVVLVVPEPGKDIAGRPAEEGSEPLALLVPREERAGDAQGGDSQDGKADGASDGSAGAAAGAAEDDGEALGTRVLQKPSVPGSVESETGELALDSVDYDEEGNVSLGGRGLPGTEVRVYLDNRMVGRAEVPPTGLWQVEPDGTVDPGSYELRVDMVREGGEVTARIALPFTQSAPMQDFSSDAFVVVQPGNSLWRIARRTMDSGLKYTVIYEANKSQIRDPDLIYPGQIFEIPAN